MDKEAETADDKAPGVAVIVMGVSGCGKSTIGKILSERMNFNFIDADEFHSAENKEKMANGIPLTDDDRIPWLTTLRRELETRTIGGKSAVLACSALRSIYRDILQGVDPGLDEGKNGTRCGNGHKETDPSVVFFHIQGTLELLESRLAARYKEGKHYMAPSLLPSQMAILETRPDEERVIAIDASLSREECVSQIQKQLRLTFRNKF